MTEFSSFGLKVILTDKFDTLAAATGYLDSQGLDQFVSYEGDPGPNIWPTYYDLNAYPTSVMIDRDGMVRLQARGAVDGGPSTLWTATAAELSGGPIP